MRLGFWPGGGGTPADLEPIAPALRAGGVEPVFVDPGYTTRTDWRLDTLGSVLAETGADAFGGTSWGGAIAARAAVASPPSALVLVDGGHFGGPDFPPDSIDEVLEMARDGKLPTDLETTEALFNEYLEYDAEETLPKLDRSTRVLMVVAGRNEASVEVVPRFERLVPWADVRVLDTGHDIVEEAPDELGSLIAEWLT